MPNTIVGPPNPFPADFLTDTLAKGAVLHRVHDGAYAANVANPSTKAVYRFSPIFDHANQVVPTLYAGATQQCAFMETVFRNVVDGASRQSIRASKLTKRVYSTLSVARELRLARLDAAALARFRVQQQQVTATSSEFYPLTARWAEAFYRADASLDGMMWVSHRAAPQMAYLLFGPSVPPADLPLASTAAPLLSDPAVWRALKRAGDEINVKIPDFVAVP